MIAKSWFSRCWQWLIGGGVAIVGALSVGVSEGVLAQIVPDNTLGAESSVVTPNLSIRGMTSDRIDGGATRGVNLFHSFGKFNVGEGRGVYFANPTGIENILTRVTGNNPSSILGRLGVLGGANLFLLNPNGIVFGPNASLDIQGSFLATTAGRIQLGETGYFSAAQPQTSSLLSVSPGALFFNAVANQPTSIINRGTLSTGKHLTLSAGNLDLQGQLLAGGDLTLQAQDTVKVRDTVTVPFLAQAGNNLTIQGDRLVDILALNHPGSGFYSGQDIVLRSANTVAGDAHYFAGGNFRLEQLDGHLGNLSSPQDPVILANGDVTIGNYTGASLHILAGGSVDLGDVTINRTDTTANTISPNNPNPSLAKLANVVLSDGTPLVIDGSTRTTLDVRAGIDWQALGGLPGNVIMGNVSPAPTVGTTATTARITTGRIDNNFLNPVILLTNQYSPNKLRSSLI